MPVGTKTFTFTYSVNWIWAIPGAGAALILAFVFASANVRPVLVFAAAVTAGVGALLTAINNVESRFAAAEAKEKDTVAAKEARDAELEHARVCAAIAFCEKWNSPDLYRAKRAGRDAIHYFREHNSVDDQLAYLQHDGARWAGLLDILNFFEALNIARSKGVVCDETAAFFFRSIVIEYWHGSEAVVKKRRADRGNVRLYSQLEELYNDWKV
jgi:hypothetical protein